MGRRPVTIRDAHAAPRGQIRLARTIAVAFVVAAGWLFAPRTAHAQTLTTLYSFCSQTNCTDGQGPVDSGGLVQDSDGNFYGTTSYGGFLDDTGTVFKITSAGELTTLYSFCSQDGDNCADGFNPTDGFLPDSGLILGSNGNFYGTTDGGGVNGNYGTVFTISPGGTYSSLYSFCSQPNCTDGQEPVYAGLVQGSDGNLYGTTAAGGIGGSSALGSGYGTVFTISAGGALTTLYSFCAQPNGGVCPDGERPLAGLVLGSDGNFYGTTSLGGANGNYGTVFKITPGGTLTTIYSFCSQSNCADGEEPEGELIQGSDGNFYGTTYGGGTNYLGTVFKITLGGTLTTLYSFCSQSNCTDGAIPQAGLMQASDGNFYGTTYGGGANNHGTVFKISSGSLLTTLYSFCSQSGCPDGESPEGGVSQGSDGSFYGTTYGGGAHAGGTIFKLSLSAPTQTITAVSGGGQSAVIGAAFANPLVVKVTDASSNPVAGATVTFAGPSSGAGASFSSAAPTASDGTTSVTATANGFASSSAYQVSASVSGVSTPATFSLTNTPAATTLTVTPSGVSLVYGQMVTINAAISPASVLTSAPTGSVAFYDGASALTPDSTVSGAAASYTVNVPTVGSHTYAAQYLGDANFEESALTNATSAVVVSKASVTVAGPATEPVRLQAGTAGSIPVSIAGEYNGSGIATPSGGLSYSVSGNAFGPGSLLVANGTATIPVPGTLAPGQYTVTVSYAGDPNYSADSINIPVIVYQPFSFLPASLPSGIVGKSYSQTLTASGGSGTGYTWIASSGTVVALEAFGLSFSSMGTISGTPTASGQTNIAVQVTDSLGDSATVTYLLTLYPALAISPTTLPVGTVGTAYSQILTASGGSGSGYAFIVTSGTGLSAVGLTLSPSGAISGTPTGTETAAAISVQVTDSLGNTAGQSYSLTISASVQGPVQVIDDESITVSTAVGVLPSQPASTSEPITVVDNVSVEVGGLPTKFVVDNEQITVSDTGTEVQLGALSGNSEPITVQDTVQVQTQDTPTTTTLTASNLLSPEGYAVTFKAVVTSSTFGTPAGTVTFYDGATALGTETLNDGTATYSTTSLSEGPNTVSAVYNGNGGFLGGSSGTIDETISGFKLSFSSNGNLTLLPGQSADVTMTVTPLYGAYPDPITFSVAGLPPGATATFSSNPVTPGSGPATANVTITDPPLTAQSQPRTNTLRLAALLALLLPIWGLYGARRRIWRSLMLLPLAVVALVAMSGISGCGGSGFFNQPPKSYTVTVTGSSGAVQHSSTLTLTVE